MAKRKQQATPRPASTPPSTKLAKVGPATISPPAKHPTLLAVSIVLFALWFLFLLVVAIWQ